MEADSTNSKATFTFSDLVEEELRSLVVAEGTLEHVNELKSPSFTIGSDEDISIPSGDTSFTCDFSEKDTSSLCQQQELAKDVDFLKEKFKKNDFRTDLLSKHPSAMTDCERFTFNSTGSIPGFGGKGDPYEVVRFVGGRHNSQIGRQQRKGTFEYLLHGLKGATLKRIGVWSGRRQIHCIKIWLSDGTRKEFGVPLGDFSEYTLQPGELITSMQLSGNGASGKQTRLGAIKFSTNRSDVGFSTTVSQAACDESEVYPICVGSGWCAGVVVHVLEVPAPSTKELLAVGFLFIKKITSSVLKNVHYPTITSIVPSVEEIESLEYDNSHSKTEHIITHKISNEIIEESEWDINAGLEVAGDFRVHSGLPELLEVSTGYVVKLSASGSYARRHAEVRRREWEIPISISPESHERVVITTGRLQIDVPYEAEMVITTADSSTLTFPVSGQYKKVQFTDIKVKKDKIS